MQFRKELVIIASAMFIVLTIVIGSGLCATPVMTCSNIKNLHFTDIAFKKPITIDSAYIVSGTLGSLVGVPELCYVHGTIWPETDFMVAMPTSGNGNLYYVGGGGLDGALLQNMMAMPPGLNLGYTTAATNGGHNSSLSILGVLMDGSFGYNPPDNSNPNYEQKKIDYAYRAAHEGQYIAKQIIGAYYGSIYPKRSYFVGCSNGGRNGMIEAQRYPEDFNGYLIGSPQLDFLGAPVRGLWNSQSQLGYAAIGYDPLWGITNLGIQAAQLKRLAGIIYNKCDALDGLKDGLINDPRKCSFDPTVDLNKWPYACEIWGGHIPALHLPREKA